MTDPTPGSPQQAGAEIVRRCGNCHWLWPTFIPNYWFSTPIWCGNDASQQAYHDVTPADTCDHWRKRGAE